jgi:Family of unknown function (DUF5715)
MRRAHRRAGASARDVTLAKVVMQKRLSISLRLGVVLVLLLAARTSAAATTDRTQALHLEALDRMMAALAPQSARAAAAIKDAYRDHLGLLVLSQYTAIEDALGNGGLVPLPLDPSAFNVAPRVAGLHPIGELDLEHQESYLSARPATLAVLLELASRVQSGPVEITSLVRHGEYQAALRAANPNANTDVPMHTMGMAFDVALINTPIETVTEIRDVLLQMRDAGDILFIGERQQLVFHVVPHPRRLGHFSDVFARLQASEAWWAANGYRTDMVVEVVAPLLPRPTLAAIAARAVDAPPPDPPGVAERVANRLLTLVGHLALVFG